MTAGIRPRRAAWRITAALWLVMTGAAALAACPPRELSDPAKVRLRGDAALIVTHASSNDDGRLASKFGVDAAVRFARHQGMPVVYLQDERPAENYFMEDCRPDHWVRSLDGEVEFDFDAAQVFVAGGHLEACLARTLNDVLDAWMRKPRRDLTLTFFMDGIFSNGKSLEEADPYYRDFQRFMGIVTYGRPAGEHFNKLTLLEIMGIVLRERDQFRYLERVLPRFERILPADYRVELRVGDSRNVRVLRPGRGRGAPVLRFEFIDSADNLEYINAG